MQQHQPRRRRPRRPAPQTAPKAVLSPHKENVKAAVAAPAPAKLQPQASEALSEFDSVLVPMLSFSSLSLESSIGGPQPADELLLGGTELEALEACLSAMSLPTRHTLPPLPAERGHSLHVQLLGGDEDMPLFGLHAEPAKHTSTPLPGRLFSRALSELLTAEPASAPSRSPKQELPPPPLFIAPAAPAVAGAPPVGEARAAHEPAVVDAPVGEPSLSVAPDAGCGQGSGVEAAVPAVAAPCPQPKMVFDSSTLQTRLAEVEREVAAFNMVQQQIRLVSGSDFVPVLPHCPVIQKLLMRTCLFPMTLVSAAARFQEMLEMVPSLHAHAQETGFWQFCSVAVAGEGGRLQVVGYSPGPLTLAHASPRLRAAFTACAFHEANRQESGPGFVLHVITADAILPAARVPAYSLADLQEWIGIALGYAVCLETAREVAMLAAGACSRVEGAVIVVT